MNENEPEFNRKIIMSDEAHFYLRGYVNKQNCRIWGSENPKIIIGIDIIELNYWKWLFLGRRDRWALVFWKWSWTGCFGKWIALSNHD